MISEDQNRALLTVGNLALQNSEWTDYANYCFDREKGLRKEAFKHLDKFLKITENWPLQKKIEFVKFIFPLFENVVDADYGPFPQPLKDTLLKSSLLAWCESEKLESNPFRWYGKYYQSTEHLFQAVEINPSDDLARVTIIRWWTDSIHFSMHHLPDVYLGDPLEGLILCEQVNDQIKQLTSPALREKWNKILEKLLEIIRNYINWKSSGHPDFEEWGHENQKLTYYWQTGTYYYEK